MDPRLLGDPEAAEAARRKQEQEFWDRKGKDNALLFAQQRNWPTFIRRDETEEERAERLNAQNQGGLGFLSNKLKLLPDGIYEKFPLDPPDRKKPITFEVVNGQITLRGKNEKEIREEIRAAFEFNGIGKGIGSDHMEFTIQHYDPNDKSINKYLGDLLVMALEEAKEAKMGLYWDPKGHVGRLVAGLPEKEKAKIFALRDEVERIRLDQEPYYKAGISHGYEVAARKLDAAAKVENLPGFQPNPSNGEQLLRDQVYGAPPNALVGEARLPAIEKEIAGIEARLAELEAAEKELQIGLVAADYIVTVHTDPATGLEKRDPKTGETQFDRLDINQAEKVILNAGAKTNREKLMNAIDRERAELQGRMGVFRQDLAAIKNQPGATPQAIAQVDNLAKKQTDLDGRLQAVQNNAQQARQVHNNLDSKFDALKVKKMDHDKKKAEDQAKKPKP